MQPESLGVSRRGPVPFPLPLPLLPLPLPALVPLELEPAVPVPVPVAVAVAVAVAVVLVKLVFAAVPPAPWLQARRPAQARPAKITCDGARALSEPVMEHSLQPFRWLHEGAIWGMLPRR